MEGYTSDLIIWKPHAFLGTGRLKNTVKSGKGKGKATKLV